MAGELRIIIDFTGVTVYAHVRNRTSQIWNTSGTPAFEAYATANIADYDIALTEQGTASKSYVGNFPAVGASGYYDVEYYLQGGGSPAETDTLLGQEAGYWDNTGSTWLPVTAERGTDSAYTGTPPTAAAIADAVLDEALSGHSTNGTLGKAVSDIDTDVFSIASTLTTVASNVATILARVGAFTGSGVNTILGFFLALMKSDASTPSDVGGDWAASTDSTEAIRDRGDAAWTGGGASDCPTLEEITSALSGLNITIASPVRQDGSIEITQGDGYDGSDIAFTAEDWTGEDVDTFQECKFALMLTSDYEAGTGEAALEVDASVEMQSGDAVFTIELTNAQTAALTPSPALDRYNYTYHLRYKEHGGNNRTVAIGAATVLRKIVA